MFYIMERDTYEYWILIFHLTRDQLFKTEKGICYVALNL